MIQSSSPTRGKPRMCECRKIWVAEAVAMVDPQGVELGGPGPPGLGLEAEAGLQDEKVAHLRLTRRSARVVPTPAAGLEAPANLVPAASPKEFPAHHLLFL